MKIEIALAIILGVVLGIAGMFAVVNLSQRTTLPASPSPVAEAIVASANTENALVQPKDNTTWDDTTIPFVGTAINMPFIVVANRDGDFLVPVVDQKFEYKLAAISGVNRYSVFTPKGNVLSQVHVLSYPALPKDHLFLQGSVTDITRDGLQMRGKDGTIEQVSFTQNLLSATFIKATKKIAVSDIAIGDQVAISSDTTEKSLIPASGAFVLDPNVTFDEYKLFSGELLKIGRNEFSIKLPDSEKTFTIDKTTKFFGLKADSSVRKRTKIIDDDLGQMFYVTNIATGSSSIARSIFISE